MSYSNLYWSLMHETCMVLMSVQTEVTALHAVTCLKFTSGLSQSSGLTEMTDLPSGSMELLPLL